MLGRHGFVFHIPGEPFFCTVSQDVSSRLRARLPQPELLDVFSRVYSEMQYVNQISPTVNSKHLLTVGNMIMFFMFNDVSY